MSSPPTRSPRRDELLDAAYRYVVDHGLGDMSLRPLAAAIGSSPRVLLYLFGSKDALVAALLTRARQDELVQLGTTCGAIAGEPPDSSRLMQVATAVWSWLADPGHRGLLTVWVDSYARSLGADPGPWAGFARDTVQDWLDLLAAAQPQEHRGSAEGAAQRTAVLALLRGAMLDLLATGQQERTTAAVRSCLLALTSGSGAAG